MKLKIKFGQESRVIDVEGDASSTTLGEVRQQVSSQFGLEDHDFQLSLNKRDFFTGDDQPLSEFGLVSGDLLHITGSDLPEPPAPQPRAQPLATYSPSTSTNQSDSQSGDSRESVRGAALSNGASVDPRSGPSDMDVCGAEQGARLDNVDGDVVAGVNRYLDEPLVIRESTASQVPILLQQLYSSTSCGSRSDALWVAVHALMLEAGFSPSECPEETVMPPAWKRPGFYTCSYTYRVAPEVTSSCSITGVTLGASIAVHGIPRTETGFKTDSVHLSSTHYIRELCDDAPSVYRAMDKLSRLIKDGICLPVINELFTAAGYRERQGLLALPSEVTLRILSYLDAKSLCHLGQTCQELKAASSDKMIWRRLYIRDFGRPVDSSLSRPWQQLYRDREQERKEDAERMRQQRHFILDPMFPYGPGAGPFRPFPPHPLHRNIVGGDYDLHPEFAAGYPHGLVQNPLPTVSLDEYFSSDAPPPDFGPPVVPGGPSVQGWPYIDPFFLA